MYPLKFEPILKQTLWGGDKIIPFKHLNDTLANVGESWEVSAVEGSESIVANGADKGLTLPDMVRKYKEDLVGEANYARFGNKFPLLIKFIDAKLDLSIQVHPGDELAKKRHNSFGKNEMWYVIAADQGAKLISGFAEQITPKEYKERVYNGTFADVLQTCAIKPGDVFYVPAGRVHGIGAGAFVAEIQQTSDITYRIFDYNRKDKDGKSRELHTSQAIDAINFADDKSIENMQQLFIEFKKYLELQKEYTKLEVTEKLSKLLSTLLLVLLVVILGVVVLFHLSFTLVYILAPLVGGLMMSFALITCFHILLIVLLVLFRKKLIIDPTVKLIAELFLDN